jgi:RHS repeat-associated protein
MAMNNRTFTYNLLGYKYGFNNKELDKEVTEYDYGLRIYDPRLAKFLSVDPIAADYPELTPYQFAANSPISNDDLDGKEPRLKIFGPCCFLLYPLGLSAFVNGSNGAKAAAAEGKNPHLGYIKGTLKGPVVGLTTGAAGAAMIYSGGRAWPVIQRIGVGALLWGSKPENQQKVVDVVNFGAELVNPNPQPLNPASPAGEISNVLKSLPKLFSLTGKLSKPLAVGLGKVKAGFFQFSENHNLIDYQNWDDFFKFGKDAMVDWSAKFNQSINETIDMGGKIIFNLDGVEKSIAQKGFGSFVDAKRAVNANGTLGQITEWELSQILRNEKWLKNTTFVKNGQVVDAGKEGLKLIK